MRREAVRYNGVTARRPSSMGGMAPTI